MSQEPEHISEIIRKRVSISFKNSPSRTKSEFAEECNINNIVNRGLKSGILPSGTRKPLFDDYSEVNDYVQIQRTIVEAEQNFMQLDAETRQFFSNNVANLLDFIDDPANAEKAAEMGLIAPVEHATEPHQEAVSETIADEVTSENSNT